MTLLSGVVSRRMAEIIPRTAVVLLGELFA